MTTDFRALCAELVDELADFQWALREAGIGCTVPDAPPLIDRARAALAEPEGEEPTDEELRECWVSECPEYECQTPLDFARAVLARWGK